MKKIMLLLLPFLIPLLSMKTGPATRNPWNEEKTDSLGPVVTVHSTGEEHSSVHYDLTRLLALKMGFSPDTVEMIARYCALVDQINPKPGYPYTLSLNGTSIPDTMPGWSEGLAGTERGGLNNNAQNEFTAQYWHLPSFFIPWLIPIPMKSAWLPIPFALTRQMILIAG